MAGRDDANRVTFTCPACRRPIPGPASLEGEDAPCPRCGADVPRWPPPAAGADPHREPPYEVVPDPPRRTRRRALDVATGLAAGGAVLLAVLCVREGAVGRGGSPPPESERRDRGRYAAGLMRDVPVSVAEFRRRGRVALDYAARADYPDTFDWVEVGVPRVYLTDAVTRRGGWYTRARLTLKEPRPLRFGNGPRGPDVLSYGEPFAWARVEMLP